MIRTVIFFFALLSAIEISSVSAWSRIPFVGAGQKNKRVAVGGQHLVHAGNALQTAADCVNDNDNYYYACPALLREAGISLTEAGDAWVDGNWEAVTYAADDCSSSFHALSQLQKLPVLQKVYKGASGELKAMAGISDFALAGPNLVALSRFLKEAAEVTKEQQAQDVSRDTLVPFCKSLKQASKSIQRLAKEQR